MSASRQERLAALLALAARAPTDGLVECGAVGGFRDAGCSCCAEFVHIDGALEAGDRQAIAFAVIEAWAAWGGIGAQELHRLARTYDAQNAKKGKEK